MSKIEWTEKTWNPIVSGCSIISKGCTNCYAMGMARRLEAMGQEKYKGLTQKSQSGKVVWNGKINIDLNDKALYEPLKRKKPTMYFVNSMTDLFHEAVPFEAMDRIMAVIALTPQHTYQLLTKRPERMREYFQGLLTEKNTDDYKNIYLQGQVMTRAALKEDYSKKPYDNLWLIASVENQETANQRIPELLATPAAVRGLSVEPLLGDIIFDKKVGSLEEVFALSFIDWVIVGGESGHNARPMHPDWVRSIRNQCNEAGVAFFFKQWGEWLPLFQKSNAFGGYYTGFSDFAIFSEFENEPVDNLTCDADWYSYDNYKAGETRKYKIQVIDKKDFNRFQTHSNPNAIKVGKHKAGRLLDGKEYSEYPTLNKKTK